MTYRPTQVNVVRMHRAGDVVTTELRLAEGRWPSPLAPATLWDEEGDARSSLMEFHHLVSVGDEFAEFESYEAPNVELTRPGSYGLISWWTPEQLAAAEDTGLTWDAKPYDGKDHDHCLLTWKTIKPRDRAYVSGAGWITVEAYEEFIRGDRLRLRG